MGAGTKSSPPPPPAKRESPWKSKVTIRDQDARAAGLVLLPKSDPWSYAKYRASGWTDAQLVADRRARRFIHPLERFDDADGTFPEIFWHWLAINGHVWDGFIKWSRESRKAGRTRYSARAIVERMRWESDIESGISTFKIGDHPTPYMSRLLMAVYPEEFAGYFSTHERGAHIVTDFITGEEKERETEEYECAG